MCTSVMVGRGQRAGAASRDKPASRRQQPAPFAMIAVPVRHPYPARIDNLKTLDPADSLGSYAAVRWSRAQVTVGAP